MKPDEDSGSGSIFHYDIDALPSLVNFALFSRAKEFREKQKLKHSNHELMVCAGILAASRNAIEGSNKSLGNQLFVLGFYDTRPTTTLNRGKLVAIFMQRIRMIL